MKLWLLSLASLVAFSAHAQESIWFSKSEVMACQVRGISADGKESEPLYSTWEGDGIFTRDKVPLYYISTDELTKPDTSLAMVEFNVGEGRRDDDTYVELNLEIDTTVEKRLAFYVFQGGQRVRRDEQDQPQPSRLTHQMLTKDEWLALKRETSITVELAPNPKNKFKSVRVNCRIDKFPEFK